MNQLTLRGFDKGLAQRIRQLAEQEQVSLNKAALKLLRRGAGLDATSAGTLAIGNRLDGFIGSWSAAQVAEFEEAVAVFEEIDPAQWS